MGLEVAPVPLLAVAVVVLIVQLALAALDYLKAAKSAEERQLEDTIRQLTAKAASLSVTADFVAKSKTERGIIEAQKKLEKAAAARRAIGTTSAGDARTLLSRYGQSGLMLLLCLVFWSQPVLVLPPKLLWPLGWLLTRGGSIGVLAWAAICHMAISRAVQALAHATGFAPPKTGGSMWDMLQQGDMMGLAKSAMGMAGGS